MTISWILFGVGVFLVLLLTVFDIDFEFFPVLTVGTFIISISATYLVCMYTIDATKTSLIISLIVSVVLTILVHAYIVPMKKAEATSGFSINDLIGSTGEVLLTMSEKEMGEVLIKNGISTSNHQAYSKSEGKIVEGEEIVVVEIKEDILYVEKVS